MILVHDFLVSSARRWPEKAFLFEEAESCTYAQTDRRSDRLAAQLQRGGLKRGDRVALFMDNSIDLVVSVFGVLKAGGVFVILNPTTKAKKLAYILNDCQVKTLLAHPSLARVVQPALESASCVQSIVWTRHSPGNDRGRTLADIADDETLSPTDPGLIDADLCTIIYTSGSTGDPKGVMLTHANMANTAWSISTYLGNVPDDVVLCVLPLSFDYGLYQVVTGARIGFSVVIEKSFAYPYRVLQRVAERKVTGFPGVPTIFATFLQMAPFEGLDLSSLRYLTNTAAAFPPAHIRRLGELLPQVRIFSMYGLTECTRVSYLDPARLQDKIGSVGKAMPNSEAYIVDESGSRLPPGMVGELVIRGANVMRGYWGKPKETAERLREGFIQGEKVLYTGDLFRIDDEGFLYFVGRKDDVFKCKGEKISPREIENVLYELEAVAEAAVIGVEDPIDGHAIKAVVVPRPGMELTEQRVRQHCRTHLENYMVPKFVDIGQALPKTDTGKIRKSSLRSPSTPGSSETSTS